MGSILGSAMGIMGGVAGVAKAAVPMAKEGIAQHYDKKAGEAAANEKIHAKVAEDAGKTAKLANALGMKTAEIKNRALSAAAKETSNDFAAKAQKFRDSADKMRGNFDMEMYMMANTLAQSQKDTQDEQRKQYRIRTGR